MEEDVAVDSVLSQKCFTGLLKQIVKELNALSYYAPSDAVWKPMIRAKSQLDEALSHAMEGVFYTHVNWSVGDLSMNELLTETAGCERPKRSSDQQDAI